MIAVVLHLGPRPFILLQCCFTVTHLQEAAISGLNCILSATNLGGVRNMRAFVTTRLIDHYEQLVFQQGELEKARLLPFAALVLGQQAGMLGQELSSMQYLLLSAIPDKKTSSLLFTDPRGYAMRRLMPEQAELLVELVERNEGLRWCHFDPKVSVGSVGNP